MTRRPLARLDAILLAAAAVLVLSLVAWPARAWAALLQGSYTLAMLGLGATFILAVTYPLKGEPAWWLRRVPEQMTRLLPWGAAGVLLVAVAHSGFYPWAGEGHELTSFQRAWLNRPAFALRALVYLGAWLALSRALVATSARRRAADSPEARARHAKLTAVFCYVFAVTIWLSAYDWLMSLEAPWASTIYGLYAFAGCGLSSVAVMSLLLLALDRRTPGLLRFGQRTDLGRWLFALSSFWVYIWFCQFLLMWYVNIPEETAWFSHRLAGAWSALFWLNVLLNWLVPFVTLLIRETKNSSYALHKMALLVLVGRWLDLYLLLGPPTAGGPPAVGLPELAGLALTVALAVKVLAPVLVEERAQ